MNKIVRRIKKKLLQPVDARRYDSQKYTRTNIINDIIQSRSYSTYLEIGVFDGSNINAINCATRRGVDPLGNYSLPLMSDRYFELYNDKFDCIFIDGLHHADQVYRDISNSIECLNPNGMIICHDIYPTTFEMQQVPRNQDEWTGDCWRAWLRYRHERDDLRMLVVDTDYGVGIIEHGRQIALPTDFSEISYKDFSQSAATLLNLITVDQFQRMYLHQ